MLLPHRKKDKKILVTRNLIAGNTALLKSIFTLFFFPVCNITSRRAVKMPRSAILIHDLSRYIWHFRAPEPHLPHLPHQQPKHLYSRDQYRIRLFPQLPFSPSSLPLEWTILFSITEQWLSFHFSTTGNVCLTFCWNQQLHFTASVFKTFYAIRF